VEDEPPQEDKNNLSPSNFNFGDEEESVNVADEHIDLVSSSLVANIKMRKMNENSEMVPENPNSQGV
jgi:hypothetical protein